ncbi:acetate--CoA ligase family protein [Jiangella asiatica]|uniref:CoA-binding protein n=1 Tax=Jiangella asiatica TaxID=2530372 RepID=A0A4R5D2P0_9ACTN|nr:acetate--CoA ligase family protein [Jiangella asiatica]TDE07446.1 CoA-binding protein [Jiangella asiatica]
MRSAERPGSGHRWHRALLSPRSVALLGASDDPSKTTARPLRFLAAAGWPGAIYPVNPARDTVDGHRAWPSLRALPEVPDHALIMTRPDLAVEAVREAAALGVPVATVMASGFAEAGAAGRRLQEQLLDAVRSSELRLLGPSSLGVANLRERLILTANAAFTEPDPPVGDVFVASQSGSVIGALLSRGAEMGIGFAGLVSTGGEADLSLGEVCMATVDDPAVASYALFLESLPDVDELRRFAVAAAARDRPIVAYKVGRSRVVNELTLSHTGVLAGDDATASAILADLGIVRVDTFEALLEAQALVRRLPAGGPPAPDRPRDRPRIGVVTTTGGGAAMVADQLAVRGADVQPPSERTRRRLHASGIEVDGAPVIDLTLAGARYDVVKTALDVLLSSGDFDLLIAVAGSSARFQPELAVRPVVDSAGAGTALAAFVVPAAPDALRTLRQSGVPAFRTPESCADAVTAALRRRAPRSAPPRVQAGSEASQLHATRTLTEDGSYQLLDRLGVPHVPWVLVDVAAPPPELPFDGPVAVKARAASLPHKSDAGGVVLDVGDAERLRHAIDTVVANVSGHAPDVHLRHCLVQPMVAGVAEVLLGYRVDASGTPVVVLADGGVAAEVLGRRSLRVAPVDLRTAHEMIDEIAASDVLGGHRGRPAGDRAALAEAVVALSGAGELRGPAVVELEANPVVVLPAGHGVAAVDALAVLAAEDNGEAPS